MAQDKLKMLGQPIALNPTKALLSLVHEAAGNVAFYRAIVQEMGSQITVPDRLQTETARAAIRLYNEERDRLEKYAQTCIKIGLAERIVKVEEKQAENIVLVLRAVVRRMNLGADKELEAIGLMRDEMLTLAKGEVIEMPTELAKSARGGNQRRIAGVV